jgi:hypothetical protein
MKEIKNIQKNFTAVLAGAVVLFFAACGEAGISDIINAAAGGGGKPPPAAELRLKTLNIYYQNDELKTSLLKFNSNTGEYTITDVLNDQGALIVEAEAEKADAKTLVFWKRGSEQDGTEDAAEGPVELSGIPAPGVEKGESLDTTIRITVSKDEKTYTYVIIAKAPGLDSSLKYLSFRYADGLTPLSNWDWDGANFWNGELLYETLSGKTYTAFDGSSQYVVELKDKDKAGSNVAITTLAGDGNSVITLTVNGKTIAAEEIPEIARAAAAFREEAGDPNGEGDGFGEDGEELPAEPVEAVNHRWLVQIPPAGGEALTIALKVTNDIVFSAYTITLVPPPDDAVISKDTRLLNIQFKDEKGTFIIPQSSEAGGFNSGTSVYQFPVSGFTGPFTIASCAPSNANATVDITYTVNGGIPQSIPYNNYADTKIPMPAKEGSVVVKFRVKIGDGKDAELNAREYSVTFTNPLGLSLWKGTATLTGNAATQYTITGLSAITSDNEAHTTVMDGDKWSTEISETQADANNPPVAFTATLKKNDDTGDARYCVVENVSGLLPNTNKALTFTVETDDKDNPLYTMAYMAEDLKQIGQNTDYYIATDIDLTKLGDWTGPSNYKGHFNGGGNTIKLELSKTSGPTGLFGVLSDGAIIENLNVEVSTKDNNPLAMLGASHFGGVIGYLSTGTYKIKGVKVKGSLKYTGGNDYLLIGSLIGEVKDGNTVKLTVEDCEADIEITGNFASSVTLGIGGLIGKNAINGSGYVTIKNSRTSGRINVTNTYASNNNLSAGGLIGIEGNYMYSPIGSPLVIENCYSSMEIVVNKTNASSHTDAGGLIGYLANSNNGSRIINSAALNPKVLAIVPSGTVYNRRVIGWYNTFNTSGGAQLSTYALAGMLTGTTADGKIIEGDGAANSADGLSKTEANFKDQATWTALNFSTDKWDFSSIPAKGYPTLKQD